MNNQTNNQINYWAGGENYGENPKTKRSIKKKLFIVFSFIFVLAITPSLIYSLMNFDTTPNREVGMISPVSQTQTESTNSKPEVHTVYIEEPKSADNQAIVIENDSYWKITKRVCGKGNNYLFVQDQNNSKPLYTGDTVTVNCTI